MKKVIYIALLSISILLTSCSGTDKVLKSSDSNLKYTKAMEWYHEGKYFKAIPVFEELMGLVKGKKSTEEIYFHYCMANFKQGNYIMSAYYFNNFTIKHPYSEYVTEALFMHAKSYEKQSLTYSLDQSETVNAIEAYQEFINVYPNDKRVIEANEKIEKLREKLEIKALAAADLYFNIKSYRAAAVSYKNLLLDYPDIDNVEEIQYKIVKSYVMFADQSIASKQSERYTEAIKTADNFLYRYKNSEYLNLVEKLKEIAHLNIIKSTYNYAMLSGYKKRIELFNDMDELYSMNYKNLSEPKYKTQANLYLEKKYFQIIKTEYAQAQESEIAKKSDYYKAAITAFNTFSTKYADSRFIIEAKRLFLAAEKNYKKYNNG